MFTVNGNVDARMASLSGNDDMTFKTVNGSVAIWVPARFDADFRFDTVHGGIDSDFPMTLSGKWGPRHAAGTNFRTQLFYPERRDQIDESPSDRCDLKIRRNGFRQRGHRVLDLRNRRGLYLEHLAYGSFGSSPRVP